MTPLPIADGAALGRWKVVKVLSTVENLAECRLIHEWLGTEARGWAFGEDFLSSPNTRQPLDNFINQIAQAYHPGLTPVLDLWEGELENGGTCLMLVRAAPPEADMSAEAFAAPFTSRSRIVPFLDALARLLTDFHALEIACDRLILDSLAFDGQRLLADPIWWPSLIKGPLLPRFPALLAPWEEQFPHGVYPLLGQPFPRVKTLANAGHLAYAAAGITEPEMQLKMLAASASDSDARGGGAGGADPAAVLALPPLVEGWGREVENIVRRCLFAHEAGMFDTPNAFAEAVAELLGTGGIAMGAGPASAPLSTPPSAPKSTAKSAASRAGAAAPAPEDPLAALAPPAASAPTPSRAPSRAPSPEDLIPPGAPPPAKPPSTPRTSAAPSTPPGASPPPHSPAPVRPTIVSTPSNGQFVPLGAEAAMVDRPIAGLERKSGKKSRKTPPPAAPVGEPVFVPAATAREGMSGTLKIALIVGGIVVVAVIIWAATHFSGSAPINGLPTAAIACETPQPKRYQEILLNASASADPDGDPLTYIWGLKGKKSEEVDVTNYIFEPNKVKNNPRTTLKIMEAGQYIVTLKVFDGKGFSPETQSTLVVEP